MAISQAESESGWINRRDSWRDSWREILRDTPEWSLITSLASEDPTDRPINVTGGIRKKRNISVPSQILHGEESIPS